MSGDAAEAFYRLIDAAYEHRSLAISSNVHPAPTTSWPPPVWTGGEISLAIDKWPIESIVIELREGLATI